MLQYVKHFYNLLKKYMYDDTKNNYNLPFYYNESDHAFNNFKINKQDINKVIFALNNMPDNIHKILFKNNPEVCETYYNITLKINSYEIVEINHNLHDINKDILNNDTRYIYVRVNLINNSFTGMMHHVNCIIIDKIENYVLFFEPKFTFNFDINILASFIDDIICLNNYKRLFPTNIGYNYYNRLQKYDHYCQSYVLFVFLLIIYNKDVHYKNFCTLFNSTITYDNLSFFLFHIKNLLDENNFIINQQEEIWSIPTDNTENIMTLIYLLLNSKKKDNAKNNNLYIQDDNDFLIIDNVD